jgi:hypothetical protein
MRSGKKDNRSSSGVKNYPQKGLWSIWPIWLICLLFFVPSVLCGQTPAPQAHPAKALFAGNSYTYVHELPRVVSAMAKASGHDLTCSMSVAGGVTLEDHLNGKRQLNTIKMIETGKHHAVILQDQSLRPIKHPELTLRDVGLLCEVIRKSGATPYLFLTWAREKSPQTQELLTQTYTQAAREHDARVVPVGIAWQHALKQKPGIALYSKDGSHPSPLGTYLSACVFYTALTGENPNGLPNEIQTTNAEGKTVVLFRISKQNATFCQRVAGQVMKTFTLEPRP